MGVYLKFLKNCLGGLYKMTKERNPFKIVQAQFDHNAEILGLDPALREFMR